MLDINPLPNISTLNSIESHFRVFAGLGSGKTTWLIRHLQKVLRESKRLSQTRRIACITYTNVAAEEIRFRLSGDKSRFDISTIHSFLYRNIVKPFSHLIAQDKNGDPLFNILALNGHEEHVPHSDRIRRWKTTIEQLNGKSYQYFTYSNNAPELIASLSNMDYFLDEEGKINVGFRYASKVAIPQSNGELWLYKKKYWSDGIMHHEDVLFFAYYILRKSPHVLDFVRNKYPYVFIDEFQDTTTLQTWIVRKIAEQETKVGVIGDLAQSIYKFAGAKRPDFENFELEGMSSYKLEVNYRSTRKIIHFLNQLRTDITQQVSTLTQEGEPVRVLIGSVENAVRWLVQNGHKNTFVLSKNNRDVEKIRHQRDVTGTNLLHRL